MQNDHVACIPWTSTTVGDIIATTVTRFVVSLLHRCRKAHPMQVQSDSSFENEKGTREIAYM